LFSSDLGISFQLDYTLVSPKVSKGIAIYKTCSLLAFI